MRVDVCTGYQNVETEYRPIGRIKREREELVDWYEGCGMEVRHRELSL